MATTKTIQPTGETITIPAMTDRPDASVFSTDVSRITDAVNTTNQALANKAGVGTGNENVPQLRGLMIASATGDSDVIEVGGGTSGAAPGTNAGGIIFTHSTRRFNLRQKNTANTNYDEFRFPSGSNSITANHVYDILTTKDFPLLCEYGTASNGSISFTAPGNRTGQFALIFYGSHFTNIAHMTNNASIFTDGIADDYTLTKDTHTYTLTRNNGSSFVYFIMWCGVV